MKKAIPIIVSALVLAVLIGYSIAQVIEPSPDAVNMKSVVVEPITKIILDQLNLSSSIITDLECETDNCKDCCLFDLIQPYASDAKYNLNRRNIRVTLWNETDGTKHTPAELAEIQNKMVTNYLNQTASDYIADQEPIHPYVAVRGGTVTITDK